jgi:hypothetical protein
VYFQVLKPWDNNNDFIGYAVELDNLYDEKSRSINSVQLEGLIKPSILNCANVRSFA